jgi:PhnB protein
MKGEMKMTANVPEGYNTINPFIITKDARKLMEFLEKVFGAKEVKEAYTMDTDGLLLHAELRIGNSTLMLADTKEGWPYTPSLLQIYVEDVEKTLQRAQELGAAIVTRPTDFYGDIFSRVVDPWDNLWWVYQHKGEITWEENTNPDKDVTWATESGELNYIHDTLLETMKRLGKR